jgi:hypothetical protein
MKCLEPFLLCWARKRRLMNTTEMVNLATEYWYLRSLDREVRAFVCMCVQTVRTKWHSMGCVFLRRATVEQCSSFSYLNFTGTCFCWPILKIWANRAMLLLANCKIFCCAAERITFLANCKFSLRVRRFANYWVVHKFVNWSALRPWLVLGQSKSDLYMSWSETKISAQKSKSQSPDYSKDLGQTSCHWGLDLFVRPHPDCSPRQLLLEWLANTRACNYSWENVFLCLRYSELCPGDYWSLTLRKSMFWGNESVSHKEVLSS